jgi:hypothetical protein
MIDFKIKQHTSKGAIVLDIVAYHHGDWYAIVKNMRSMQDVYDFFATAKQIVWNADGISGKYIF